MTQVDISSTVMGVFMTFAGTAIVAVVAQYFDYRSFKKSTVKKLSEIDEHLEFSDTNNNEVKILLTKVITNQDNHQKNDDTFFGWMKEWSEGIDNSLKEIWQKK